jgi:hypothetical protein
MYRFHGEDANTVWDSSLEKVSLYLNKSHTDPSLSSALITCLSSWRESSPIHMSDIAPSVRHVVAQQHALGWHHMFGGVVVKQWHQHQDHVFAQGKKRKSGRKWLIGLIHRLMNLGPQSVAPSQFYQAHYETSSTPTC